MNDNCEVCGSKLTDKNIEEIILINKNRNIPINKMFVCTLCYRDYEFTIGVVEWEEEK